MEDKTSPISDLIMPPQTQVQPMDRKGFRNFESSTDSSAFVAEIQARTIRQGKLAIPQYFWEANGAQLPPTLALVLNQSLSEVGTSVSAAGRAYLDDGWPDFMEAHKLQWSNLLYFNYLGQGTFFVEMIEEEEEDGSNTPAERVVEISSEEEDQKEEEDGSNTPAEGVVEISSEEEDQEEVDEEEVPLKTGRRRASVQLPASVHFGCEYPVYSKPTREISFTFLQAEILRNERTRVWTLAERASGRTWEVKLAIYHNRAKFLAGWTRMRDDLALKAGDLLFFTVVDQGPASPTMEIEHVRKGTD